MRSKTLTPTPSTTVSIAAMSFVLLAAGAGSALAGYGPRGIADLLYSRGYYNIQIVDRDDDEYEVVACRGNSLYEIEIKRDGRIDDVDHEGRCLPHHSSRGYYRREVHVTAPFTDVETGKRGVHVEAPFTGVHVDRGGVHVRAPFVDLHVPRR